MGDGVGGQVFIKKKKRQLCGRQRVGKTKIYTEYTKRSRTRRINYLTYNCDSNTKEI